MQPRKIRYQAQEYERGCSIASLAMVLDRKQSDIDADFQTDFSKKGVPITVVSQYLLDHGLIVVEKRALNSGDKRKHNERMLKPFADVHIVMAQTVADNKINHIFVMDKHGKVYDPDKKDAKPTDYYYVITSLGIFWD